MVEGCHLDHTVGHPAQRHRQRRNLGAPIVRVGDDDHVGRQRVTMGGQQSAQRRRTGLLLAFDEYRHADRRIATVRPERRQMRCDTGLVVGAPAPVEPAVALGRLERRRRPLRRIALGLHIVVGVQQHGRRTRRRGMAGDDGGRTALADDLYIAKTCLRQQLCGHLGAAVHLVAAGRVGPHRLDADQILQIVADRRQQLAHAFDQIAHGLEASRAASTRDAKPIRHWSLSVAAAVVPTSRDKAVSG